jgi:hypothetical protein
MNKILKFITPLLILASNSNAGIYCKYLNSCSEACNYYNQGYYRLDRDRDGIPCENLCSSPCSSPSRHKKHHKAYISKTTHKHSSYGSFSSHTTAHSKHKRHLHNEKYYQKEFCKKVLGIMEYRLKDGTRIDCYTSTYSFEVDFAKKAYEAIGQSLHYADMISNKPGIVLIVRNKKDMHYVRRIKHTAKKYGIKIFTINDNLKIKVVK